MIVLAFDTAGANCSAAVYDNVTDVVLAEASETIGRGHAERLMAMIDHVLDEAKITLDAVERIAVTVGPGSFTGIRVGVAAARGLALALGVEAVGVSTLAVLARRHLEKAPDRPVVAAIDAQRDVVYVQAFSAGGDPLNEPAAMTVDEAREMARTFAAAATGSAAPLLRRESQGGETDVFPVALVALRGAAAVAGDGKPRPVYLRAPDAKPQPGSRFRALEDAS